MSLWPEVYIPQDMSTDLVMLSRILIYIHIYWICVIDLPIFFRVTLLALGKLKQDLQNKSPATANHNKTQQSTNHIHNYANPVYGVATIWHQVRWLHWGHQSLFRIATSLLISYKMFCVRDISYRLIWMEFKNVLSTDAQSGTQGRFNW